MTPHASRPAAGALLLLALVCLMAVCAATAVFAAPAAIRYVSQSGNDAAGANLCLDAAAPCATLSHAFTTAAAGDTISLANGVYHEAGLLVTRPVNLLGQGATGTILDGQGRGPLLTIVAGGALTLNGVTLRGGASRLGGAVAVESGASLLARHSVFAGNQADWGGALYVAGGSAIIEDSTLAGNTAASGGAIFIAAGSLTMTRATIAGNAAGLGGGLLVGPGALVTLSQTTVQDNEARQLGGGAHVQGALHATNTLWRDNRAASGGGIYSDGGAVALAHAMLAGNASGVGSGLAGQGDLRLSNSILTGNEGDHCAATLTGSDNLIDDASCGVPARPVTGLLPDGRPGDLSNAIDAIPAGRCLGPSGAGVPLDLRGEPRPVDGDRDGAPRCDIGPYEFQPRIVIAHTANPADATQFRFAGDLGEFKLAAGATPWRAFDAPYGQFQLTEARMTGWKVNAVACAGDADGGTLTDAKARAATIDLDSGEAIVCTFSARATRGSIGLRLVADGLVAVPFSGDLGDFDLRAPDRLDRRSGALPAGVYSVQAQPPPGWRVAAVACAGERDAGSTFDLVLGVATIDLDAKETLSCTFTLERTTAGGALTIRLEATPADDAPFTYTGDLGPFALRAASQPATTFALSPGLYRVHELLHPAWTLVDVACAGDTDGDTMSAVESATATIDLDAGEAITCTFRHARPGSATGSITLVQATSGGEAATFYYSGALGDFALSTPGTTERAWPALPAGSYTVWQSAATGWRLADITCIGDNDGGSDLAAGEERATLDLDPGESLVCTFTNARRAEKKGSIAIVHEPATADDTPFDYSGPLGTFALSSPSWPRQGYGGLPVGAYVVSLTLPPGWQHGAIVCEGDADAGSAYDPSRGRVTVDLDADEAITCTFRPSRDDAPVPQYTIYVPHLGR